MQSDRIDSRLRLKFITLSCDIEKVANEPLICDLVLLANPALIEESDPNHHDNAIYEA